MSRPRFYFGWNSCALAVHVAPLEEAEADFELACLTASASACGIPRPIGVDEARRA